MLKKEKTGFTGIKTFFVLAILLATTSIIHAQITFTDINAGLPAVSYSSLCWGDYDNDGDLDLAIAGYASSGAISKIYRNDNGNFVDINAGLTGASGCALSWGDYDNDGDMDLAIAGYTGSYEISKIYRNDNGNFVDINAGLTGASGCALSWGDYDNDGDLDLAIAGYTGSSRISKIYRNDNGNFVDINAGLTGVFDCALSWCDYDNDGDLDLTIAGALSFYDRISKIYRNDNGNFVDINAGLPGVRNCALSWGDYDNDGDLDLAIAGNTGSSRISKIYRNDNGNFVDINAGLTSIAYCTLSWGDYDNDGDLDLAIAGNTGSSRISKIYRNDGCDNNWIDIQTRGFQSNADGVGAWVKCGSSSQWREISAGEGWVNRLAHFGIGNQTEIDEITCHWPTSGITDTLIQVQANKKIKVIEGGVPIVNITPNGGEILPGAPGQGNTYEIMWDVENPPTNIDYITIHYSTDSGNSFPYLIADNEPDDSSYIWTVPNVNSSNVRVRIQLKDDMGTVLAEGISEGDFSIDNIPPSGTITLVSPANGDWTSDTPYFDWSSSGLVDVTNIGIIVDGEYLVTGLSTSPTYYQTPPELALGSGWHTWTVRGFDVAGNWMQASQTWSIRVDATPPSQFSLLSPEDSLWTANDSPSFQWNPSMDNESGLDEYNFYINGSMYVVSSSVTQWTASGLSDGDYDWYVEAVDNVGNSQQSNETYFLHIDTTPPHGETGYFSCISPSNNFWTADSLTTFSWSSCVDDGIGLEYYELYIDGTSISGEIIDTNYVLTPQQILVNGTHNWYVIAVDSLNNSNSTSQFTLNIDRIPPAEFSLISPADSSFFIMPTPTFEWDATTDAGCGLSHYELWIDDALSVDNISQTQTSPGAALSEGNNRWFVIAEDNVGNRIQSTESWTAIGDWNPPTQPILISPINNEIVSLSQPDMKWLKSTDAGSGVSHYDLYVSNELVYENFVPDDINADTVSVICPISLENGNHTWYVRAFDYAGGQNSSIYGFFEVDVDITPPTSEISDPVLDQYIGGESYLITGSADDNIGGVGIDKVEISFDGGNTWFETIPTEIFDNNNFTSREKVKTTSEKKSLNSLFPNELASSDDYSLERLDYNWEFDWFGYTTGSVTIMTRSFDHNGNMESPPNDIQVNVEIIQPTISNISVNPDPATVGTVNFTIHFQTGEHCGGMNNAVTPTVTYTPSGSSVTPITQTNYQGNTWQGQTTIAQTDNNGTAMIKVSAGKDNINNVMLPDSSHSFVIDTHSPYTFDLLNPPDSSWINTAQPTLSWGVANDSTTSIDHYTLEIDGSTNSPGISYINPGNTSTNPAEDLTLGNHTWRIKATDQAGNLRWSNSMYNVGVDLSDPVSFVTSPSDNGTIGGLSYTITGTSSDGSGVGVSGVENVEMRISHNGTWTSWMQVINTGTDYNTWSYEWTNYESGTYIIESRAEDKAGNIEIPQLQTSVIVDLNPPVVETAIVQPNPASVGEITCSVTFDVNDLGLNFSVHPDVWFTAANGDSIAFVETSYSDVTWTGNATISEVIFNGVAIVHVINIVDNLNNYMTPNNNAGTFTIDTQAPIVSLINVIPEITNIRNDLQVEVIFEELTSGLNSNVAPIVKLIPYGSVTEWIPVTQTGYNTQTNIWSGIAEITGQTNEGEADIIVSLTEDLAGNVMSETTLTNQFIIDHSPPVEFDLIYPSDSLWISNRQPEFIWNSSSDIFSGLSCYQLFINDNQVGANIPPADTTHVISTSLPDGGYRTRIKALDNSLEPNIRWSGIDSLNFNIDGTSPNTDIAFPSSGYVVQGCSLNVNGTANDGIGVYAGIGVETVLLSSDGGSNWDVVYEAPEQFLGEIEWGFEYCLTPGPHTIVAKSIDWLGNEEIDGSSVSITVESIPAPPANVYINIIEDDAVISWSRVDTTIYGNPINIGGYIIYSSSSPDSEFVYLASTTDTTYTDVTVYESTKMFYKVTAYSGDFPTMLEIIPEHHDVKLGELEIFLDKKGFFKRMQK